MRILKRKQKQMIKKRIQYHLKAFRTKHGVDTPDALKAYTLYRSNLYHEMGIKNKHSENHVPLPEEDVKEELE